MWARLIRGLAAATAICFTLCSCGMNSELLGGADKNENEEQESGYVDTLTFRYVSENEIELVWPDIKHLKGETYRVVRRSPGEGEWIELGTVETDETVSKGTLKYRDVYDTTDPIQYEYRVDVVRESGNLSDKEMEGTPILASNVLLCLDPGHYGGANPVDVSEDSEEAPYSEGDFCLELGLALRSILKNEYGISVRMTRDTGTITIGGYTNSKLDYPHIRLRGEAAEGCRMFLSLHTNANADHANQSHTLYQPQGITKTLVIMNQTGIEDDQAIRAANAIGRNVSTCNYDLGIAKSAEFIEVSDFESMTEITGVYNDALDTPGTVCYHFTKGHDYYGVLRGATNVNVPGMIVEHGFHTVAKMRRLAADGTLSDAWAKADAEGIAEGFGFRK